MAKINVNELTKEQLAKAAECETAEELMELAKSGGYELTKEEAEAYLAEFADGDLDKAELKQVAGGRNNGCFKVFGGCGRNYMKI